MSTEAVKDLFAVAEQAQLTVMDVAALTGVSRETLYRWRAGRPSKDKLRLHMVQHTASRLRSAIKQNMLPLREKLKTKERRSAVRKILKTVAKQQ